MGTRASLVAGAALGALAVALGAFGAHALQGVLSERALGWFATAVDYHARHALALLACGLLGGLRERLSGASERDAPGRTLGIASACFVAGIAIFSGSLYLMAFTGATWLGAITPIGGVLLVAGWVALGVAAARG